MKAIKLTWAGVLAVVALLLFGLAGLGVISGSAQSLLGLTKSRTFILERDYFDLATDFALALSSNDPRSYHLADSSLWPRLNEWMATHQPNQCRKVMGDILSIGPPTRVTVAYDCYLEDGGALAFAVVNATIGEQGKVLDWERVDQECFAGAKC